jgi:hypothetical protein
VDARQFVHTLGLKSQAEWASYRKSGHKPSDIPSNPNRTYKNECKSWDDWLGTGFIAASKKNTGHLKRQGNMFIHFI